MILINGQWEEATTQDDCMKIIRENLGEEFADKTVEIIGFQPRVPEEIEDAIEDLKKMRDKMNCVIQYLINWKRDLEEQD